MEWRALGPERAKALPAFHAFTGADNIGRFSRIGKATWLQAYLKADEAVINALQMLQDDVAVTEGMLSTLATFVCAAYAPKGIKIKTIPGVGIYSASTWQKVTSSHQQSELSNRSS